MNKIRKLVRDGYINSQSIHPGAKFEEADPSEYDKLLLEKTNEELLELNDAIQNGDTNDIAEEAADAIEAILARSSHAGVNSDQVESARKEKKEKLGGFDKKIVLVRN